MAQVARPVGLKALAPDCHLASGELRLPLALADQRLLARGQPAAVGRSPARGRLRAPRRAHHDEPAARLGVGVDTASDSASSACSATICAVISALVSLGTSGLRFQPRFSAFAWSRHEVLPRRREPACLQALSPMRRRGLEPPPGYP